MTSPLPAHHLSSSSPPSYHCRCARHHHHTPSHLRSPLSRSSTPPIAARIRQCRCHSLTTMTLLELVIALVWACLLVPGGKNQLFVQLFFAVDVVSDLAAAASLSFCPGLLEVLNATSPPTVAWFKQLPDDYRKRWGVYVLVFKQDGFVPYLYCGSATESKRGIASRWALYDKHNVRLRDNTEGLPSGVIKAFEAGFKITHKGLLVTAPIPSAANVPTSRLLFYAMEATFAFAFWMMDSRKFYPYHACCRWSLESFTYMGLCSHSALHDSIAGRFDLSSAELTALAVTVQEKSRAYHAAYRAAKLAEDPEGWRAKKKLHQDTFREKNLEVARAIKARSAAKTKSLGRYPGCTLCGVPHFKSQWESDRHDRSRVHKVNVEKEKAGVVKPYKCSTCGYSTSVKDSLRRHKDGKLHKQRVANAQAAAAAAST